MKEYQANIFDVLVSEDDKISFDYLKWLTMSLGEIYSDGETFIAARKDDSSPMWIYSPCFESVSQELYKLILDNTVYGKRLRIISNQACFGLLKDLSGKNGIELQKYMNINVYSGSIAEPSDCGEARLVLPTKDDEKDVLALVEAMISESRMTDLKSADAPLFTDYAMTSGNVFLLFEEKIRGMANIAYRNGRFARINTIITSPDSRGCGYGSKLISSLCQMLSKEGFAPIIFADADYPASNRLYSALGLANVGVLAEYRFGV